MGRLDCSSSNLFLRAANGTELPIRDLDVHLVLGLPYKGLAVVQDPADVSSTFVEEIKALMLADNASSSLTLDYVEHLLSKEYPGGMNKREEDAFRIAVVLFSFAIFLGTQPQEFGVPLGILRNLVDPGYICSFNWSRYVLQCLSRSARHAQLQVASQCNPIILHGCTLLLQVFYLDNMDFGPLNRAHTALPRVADFNSQCLSTLIDAARSYGRSKPRDTSSVCYSRGRQMKSASTTDHDEGPSTNASNAHVPLDKILKVLQEHKESLFTSVAGEIERHQVTLVDAITALTNTNHQNSGTAISSDLNNESQTTAGGKNPVRARTKTVAHRCRASSKHGATTTTPTTFGGFGISGSNVDFHTSSNIVPYVDQSTGMQGNITCNYHPNTTGPTNDECSAQCYTGIQLQEGIIQTPEYNCDISGIICQVEPMEVVPIDVAYPGVLGPVEFGNSVDAPRMQHGQNTGPMLIEGPPTLEQTQDYNDHAGNTFQLRLLDVLLPPIFGPVITENIDLRHLFAYFGLGATPHVGSDFQELSISATSSLSQSRDGMEVDQELPSSSNPVQRLQQQPHQQLQQQQPSVVEIVNVDSDEASADEAPEATVKIVHSHSNFVPHPDDLGLYHYGPPEKKAKQIFEAYAGGYVRLTSDHFVHNVPTPLIISGIDLCWEMMLGGSFGVPLCDAIMRLYKWLDDLMYQPGQTRWRHFLPASFTAKVLSGGNYLEDPAVRAAFIGNHISYNVEDCTMIIAPVLSQGYWSCYFWDFSQRRIHVLDPTMMKTSVGSVQVRHYAHVSRLTVAISRCKDTFFHGWGVDMYGWGRSFPVGLGPTCRKNNSGLFATHYARAYDGADLLWALKTSEHAINRAELLYQLLSMAGNCGDIPSLMIDLMEI